MTDHSQLTAREQAALNTVEQLGFEYGGGTVWKMPPGKEWLPIATAPRVSKVLVTNEGYREVVSIASQIHRGNNVWVWVTNDNESVKTGYFEEGEPTHWMPLPVSPQREVTP